MIRVVGKKRPVRVFEPVAERESGLAGGDRKGRALRARARGLPGDGIGTGPSRLFRRLPDDPPAGDLPPTLCGLPTVPRRAGLGRGLRTRGEIGEGRHGGSILGGPGIVPVAGKGQDALRRATRPALRSCPGRERSSSSMRGRASKTSATVSSGSAGRSPSGSRSS